MARTGVRKISPVACGFSHDTAAILVIIHWTNPILEHRQEFGESNPCMKDKNLLINDLVRETSENFISRPDILIWSITGLQIRECIGKLFSLFLTQNICCWYSKEPSQ